MGGFTNIREERLCERRLRDKMREKKTQRARRQALLSIELISTGTSLCKSILSVGCFLRLLQNASFPAPSARMCIVRSFFLLVFKYRFCFHFVYFAPLTLRPFPRNGFVPELDSSMEGILPFVKQKLEERKFNEGRRHKSIRIALKVLWGRRRAYERGKPRGLKSARECWGHRIRFLVKREPL